MPSFQSLDKTLVGKTVSLHGYLDLRRDVAGNLSFANLVNPELSHTIQLVSFTGTADWGWDKHREFKQIPRHSPITVTGVLRTRKNARKKQAELGMVTEVELELRDATALNEFPREVMLEPNTVFTPEQRHLQLRTSPVLQDALAFRSKVGHHLRGELISKGFNEIETPILFKPTPEGAREFIVPTRRKARAYALVQSPQQYKQILMASGVRRYFQFAKCFRDEDLRADRQPEFTQLDLEMAFADEHTVMRSVEEIIISLWKKFLNIELDEPFPRLEYQMAMSRYGSDKPDTRIGMEVRMPSPADSANADRSKTHPGTSRETNCRV
jgi:aspartyl-tRNA synthetase